jgi:hypothetical protein
MVMRVSRNAPRSELIGMALVTCAQCRGTGLTLETGQVCKCVHRAVFRACLGRYCDCTIGAHCIAPISLEHSGSSAHGRTNYGRKHEEYMADFWLVSKRTLDAFEWKVFSFHYLLGADWKLCTRRLNIDRGNFFHACYRLEERLGKVYAELKPYSLYPLDEYFGGTVRGARTTALLAQDRQQPQPQPRREPLRPPMAVAA